MTNPHPLTNDLAENIALDAQWSSDIGNVVFTYDDMRAAYDKGFSDAIECIRKEGLAHYSALYEAQERFYKQQEDNNAG